MFTSDYAINNQVELLWYMASNCLDCGSQMFGRSDKKFCSSQCRTSYHNKQNAHANSYVRKVNYILKKNRRILILSCPQGINKVSKIELINKGFNFDYFTSEYINIEGKRYRYSYEYGYLELSSDLVAIVKKPKFVHS